MAKKQSPEAATKSSTSTGVKKPAYEPPKLMKFEKLERLIVSGE